MTPRDAIFARADPRQPYDWHVNALIPFQAVATAFLSMAKCTFTRTGPGSKLQNRAMDTALAVNRYADYSLNYVYTVEQLFCDPTVSGTNSSMEYMKHGLPTGPHNFELARDAHRIMGPLPSTCSCCTSRGPP